MELKDIFLNQTYYSTTQYLPFEITDDVFTILDKKYLRGESPHAMLTRVAFATASALTDKVPPELHNQIIFAFYNLLATRDFMPNSPTLMNAGRPFNQLAACFVVPVEDSMEGIFRDAIADMAMIQRTGGGTGFDFSELRPKGSKVSSTNGESSGPIPFMRAFNACTDTIKQGGSRRGANMGVLRVDHPDIREFILLKTIPEEMTNFNLSVAVTDDFMRAVEKDHPYPLMHKGKVYGSENAREIWDMICECAWLTGEPGVLFIDRINAKNTLPGLGEITATNPCGEQPLLPYEACNLGSINLKHMVKDGKLDEEKLKATTKLATVFLDCVIDAGSYPLPQITQMAQDNRKIGLGVMGFADLCYLLEIPYNSAEAMQLASSAMFIINDTAKETSELLGRTFGSFPNLAESIYTKPIRNATRTTIAPTGTIAIIAGANYGIEPFFALSYNKTLTDTNEEIYFLNEHVIHYMEKHKFSKDLMKAIEEYIFTNGSLQGAFEAIPGGAPVIQMEEIFVTAQDIAPVDHIYIQAAFQKHTDSAVSKTINLKHSATTDDVAQMFTTAYRQGCKGITVYRDGCRDSQPLKVTKEIKAKVVGVKNDKKNGLKRPTQLRGITRQIPTGCGMMLVTVNMDDQNEVFETLMRAGASGGCSAYTDAVARLISIALRYDVPLDVIIDQLRSVRCDNFRYQSGKNPKLKGKSCPDVVGQFLQEIVDNKSTEPTPVIDAEQLDKILQQATINTTGAPGLTCPDCGKILLRTEGCLSCQCGYSRC